MPAPWNGSIYYKASARHGDLSIVIHCQGTAGNDAAAVATERLIAIWQPEFAFLVGIAAGRKGKVRIGDVVTSRVVVDDTRGLARAGQRLKRPFIGRPPYHMIQCLQRYRPDVGRWHSRLFGLMKPPKPPKRLEDWYRSTWRPSRGRRKPPLLIEPVAARPPCSRGARALYAPTDSSW